MNRSWQVALVVGAVLAALMAPGRLLPGGAGGSLRADESEVLRQLEHSRSVHRDAKSWATRRDELRQEFLKGARLWPLPDRPPVTAIAHRRRVHDGYTVESVALETLPGFYCTGNLYQPLGRKAAGPAILCPHGHFRPLGRYREDHQIRCAQLARLGATVFSYSMVGWQDSSQTTHHDPLVLALQTWNSLRAVDFVSGLPRVDAERIGVTGASGGGTQAMFLTLIDDRVTASAPLVIVYPWAAPQGCLCEGGMPVMQAARTNAIELAAAAAPRPQLLISVGNDPTERFPQVGFPFIKQMYEVAGAGGLVANLHLADEGHDFGPTKRREVYRFFARHLRMRPETFYAPGDEDAWEKALREEELARIKIETPEQLAAFDEENPLPAHAVRGSQAVGRVFNEYLTQLRHDQAASVDAAATDLEPARAARPVAEYAFEPSGPADEALIFTPPGFQQAGRPQVAQGPERRRTIASRPIAGLRAL